jgi:nucleoside-diphosphate-sugar epimerase
MEVLVTGGSGYIGSTLIPLLLRDNHKVTVLDNLLHGSDAILPFFRNQNFKFIRGDVRDLKTVESAMKGKDGIVHLAAIVGMPACKDNPIEARTVNVEGSHNIRQAAYGQRIVYASTVSAYGKFEGGSCAETEPLKPISLYGETKAEAEGILLSYPGTTALRLATLFGISPRMRLDLLVNDFTYQAVHTRNLIVYQADFVRSVLHVSDAARAIIMSLLEIDMAGEVYNVVGCNPTKREICETIKKETGAYFHFAEVGMDVDQRSAAVNGDKLHEQGWHPYCTLDSGIHEMARAFQALKIPNPYANA